MRPCPLLALALCLSCIMPATLRAQSEIERGRASLHGLDGFFLTIDVEGGPLLAEQAPLRVARLWGEAAAQLRAAGLTVWTDEHAAPARLPLLYVHVNMLDAGRGLVPFAIEVQLHQRVRLARDAALATTAATWDTSVVGLVTYDQLPVVAEALSPLLDVFIDDVLRANP